MLGHGSQNVDGKTGGIGHIAGAELHPTFHQVRDDGDGSRQPVELGDQQRQLLAAAEFEGFAEFGAISPLSTLHLHEGGRELAARAGEVFGNGGLLGLQPQAGASLLVGGHPIIGDPKRSDAVFHG